MTRLASLATLLLAGCAEGALPAPSATHPSSPGAAEGIAYVAPSPAPSVDHTRHDHGAATIYTCPMHPEVTSDKPGQCPHCGMNLVPKEQDTP